ncbi:protein of unknown function [Formivibrio citricus]|uniref:AsmA family protein n=1 Tax=Formivibrio citricus TaxID=83765 RepID=A0A1I5DRR3_9NEIS|nr:DUF748 domain-containing protein [Formivibrio citricus]SFO01461.1 protein of unknown function [Formivibrio citricus]
MNIAHYFTRRVRISLYTLATLLVVFGLFGFLVLPGIVKPRLEQAASAALQRNVSIGKVEINPYLYRLTLRDVAIQEKDGPLLRLASLTADAEFSSLWRGGPVLREITLDSPQVRIVRLAADRYNFSDLLEKKPDAPKKTDAALPRFSLGNIRILNGRIDFDDRFQNTRQEISELELTLPFISTLPQRADQYIEPGIAGKLNGSPFRLAGQSKPFKDSRETRLSLTLDKLDLPHYLTYVTLPKDIRFPGGKLSGQLDVVFRMEKDQARLLLEGKLGLSDGRLDFRGEPLLALPAVNVEMKDLEPLAQKFRFSHIGIDKPALHVARAASGELNWLSAFAGEKTAAKPATANATPLPLVEVGSLTLEEGRIEWKDAAVKPAHTERVEAISIQAKQLSTAAKASSPVSVSFKTGHGESFKTDLQLQPTPLTAEGRIELDNIQPGRHAPYLKPFFVGDIANGQIATRLNFRFSAEPFALTVSEGQFGIENLAVRLAGEKQPALKLAALNASGIGLDLGKKQLELASLNAKGAEVFAVHNKDDSFNLVKLLPPSKAAPAKSTAKEAPWRVKVAQLALENNALRLEDRRREKTPPLALSAIDLRAQNLDTVRGSQAQLTLSARSGKRGQIRIAGPFVPQPFSAKWQLDINDFDAAFAQSYLAQYLNVQLASLLINAKGETQVATEPKMSVRYRGNMAVNNFLAIDRVNGANFLRWRTLALNGINAQSEPARLDLNEIALTDFYSRLILSKSGRLNLQDILVQNGQATSITSGETASAPAAKPETASAPAKAREPLPPIRIGKVKLAKGNINYTDNFIQPNFTANLTDMGGEITGLSSKADTRASVDLRGSVDRIAPVTVAGSLNPLAQPMFLDIKSAVKGYELTAASTYSAKYAGYGIEKGKLSMDVAYFIENNKLKAANQLFLDQLTLGDKVDSPDATKLPVKFALALLTDRRGQINLNLPIEGSLDDPQFRIGRIIWQVIGNLLEKAVTSPFSALGSLFGGKEESFSRVEFEPGRAALNAEASQSLAKLAQALNDRPALKLDMAGWIDPAADREGIRRNKLNAKIRARKLAQFTDKGQSSEQAERAITPEEYPKLLAQVYGQEKFAKPRNLVGLAKSLPPAEMEKLIMANTPVSDDELNALALRRATTVKDALKAAGLDDARLFILKPQLVPPADVLKKDGGKATRVQFVLK